jgi:hypothetical protein
MVENHQPLDKSTLLDLIQSERARLESLLVELTEAQMTKPGVEADWSIKDILAHIAAWERLAMDRIQAAQTGGVLKYPLIAGDEFVDQFNAQNYEAHKHQSLSEIQAEFQNAHQEFIAQIESLPEERLSQRLNFDWSGKLTYQVMISANTHWHYPDHAAAIEKWLENLD